MYMQGVRGNGGRSARSAQVLLQLRVVRVEIHRLLVPTVDRLLVLPLVKQRQPQPGVALHVGRVDLDRVLAVGDGLLQALLVPPPRVHGGAVGEVDRVGGVKLDRLSVGPQRSLEVARAESGVALQLALLRRLSPPYPRAGIFDPHYFRDKNTRHIGEFQSRRPHQQTETPPPTCLSSSELGAASGIAGAGTSVGAYLLKNFCLALAKRSLNAALPTVQPLKKPYISPPTSSEQRATPATPATFAARGQPQERWNCTLLDTSTTNFAKASLSSCDSSPSAAGPTTAGGGALSCA
jgi:hypothetical protein